MKHKLVVSQGTVTALWLDSSYLLEMSSSWNFPARASPSCEGSEPSRAELGHYNFRAETELKPS